jgi:hypothetical protein
LTSGKIARANRSSAAESSSGFSIFLGAVLREFCVFTSVCSLFCGRTSISDVLLLNWLSDSLLCARCTTSVFPDVPPEELFFFTKGSGERCTVAAVREDDGDEDEWDELLRVDVLCALAMLLPVVRAGSLGCSGVR